MVVFIARSATAKPLVIARRPQADETIPKPFAKTGDCRGAVRLAMTGLEEIQKSRGGILSQILPFQQHFHEGVDPGLKLGEGKPVSKND
jgi:hypothetical protein